MKKETKTVAELKSAKKVVTLTFGPLTVTKVIKPPKDSASENVKIIVRQEVKREITVIKHITLEGEKVYNSPVYTDIRTKSQIVKASTVKSKRIKEGSILKKEFIQRVCSDRPFWPTQKKSSSGFFTSTEILGIERVLEGDLLKLEGQAIEKALATERDIYVQKDSIIKNIALHDKSKATTKTKLIVTKE